MKWDFCKGDAVEDDLLACSSNGGAGVIVIEDVIREVDGNARGTLLRDGADENGVSIEVLQVDSWRLRVGWVEIEHWVQKGFTSLCLAVEGCVDIVKQLVSSLDGVASGFCDNIPAIELLGPSLKVVVVAEERLEGTQSCPPGAEFLGRVTSEATHI